MKSALEDLGKEGWGGRRMGWEENGVGRRMGGEENKEGNSTVRGGRRSALPSFGLPIQGASLWVQASLWSVKELRNLACVSKTNVGSGGGSGV